MRLKWELIYLIIIVEVLHVAVCFFDPVTIAIGAGVGLGAWNFGFVKDQTYCRWAECCNEHYIPGDIKKLEERLKRELIGQHIVLKHIIPAFQAHFAKNRSRKPLVISLQGTAGTGKNLVADIIADALYEKGVNSKYVHKYFGRLDFNLEHNLHSYKERISKEVREGISDCPRSLFIFDEVDKMPPGIFDSLTSLVDFNLKIDGKENTQAIFIFLSNTAGAHISDRLGSLLEEGISREDTKLSHFEQTLQMAAYNMDGGLKKASLIESHAIDHFFPFLPFEKKHIYLCIKAEFDRWSVVATESQKQSIIEEIVYDRKYGLFSISGCKTIEKKVAKLALSRN